VDSGFAGEKPGQGFFDLFLDAAADLLQLPAGVGGAVVSDDQLEFKVGGH
jgi:hypothetical protein